MFLYFINEKFNKNAKVKYLTKVVLSLVEEKDLIVKDPFSVLNRVDRVVHMLNNA